MIALFSIPQNTVQRLQLAAGDGKIIISEAAYEKVKESFNCKKIDVAVALKNNSAALVLYEVLD